MNHVTLSGTVFQPESRVAKSGMAVLVSTVGGAPREIVKQYIESQKASKRK